MNSKLMFFALLLLLILGGCKKNDPVSPPPPPPSMSGRWDYTLSGPGGSVTGLMDLTENNGSLSGTFTYADFTGPISGTVSTSYQVTLGGGDAAARILITGTTNSSKSTFNGKMEFWDRRTNPETYLGSLTMTASKR